MAIPPGTRRLFPGYEERDLQGSSLLIARLLEDGDREDLAWLTSTLTEEDLAGWLGRHGGRQLSRRSRAFWEAVLAPLDNPGGDRPDAGDLLWPL
ncbi:MAG TPA: hypothetical protein VF756_21480 [Thermoanaerobaculia bacterium]